MAPAKHTCTPRGTYEVVIGALRFPETSIFEIIYTANPASALLSRQHLPGRESSTTSPDSTFSFSLSPAVLSQLNTLASVNPDVAKLLRLAHTEQATAAQLRELGSIIESLMSYATTAEQACMDMALEYRERPGHRWLIPRDEAHWKLDAQSNAIIRTKAKGASGTTDFVTIQLRPADSSLVALLERWVDPRDAIEMNQKWDTHVRSRDSDLPTSS
jgi:hypothetical protein